MIYDYKLLRRPENDEIYVTNVVIEDEEADEDDSTLTVSLKIE